MVIESSHFMTLKLAGWMA